MPYTDTELVEAALNDDKVAFGMLVERFQKEAFRIAFRLVKNVETAEDLTQEAFIKAYQNLEHLNDKTKFKSWLFRIISNICVSWLRKREVETISLETLPCLDGISGAIDFVTPDHILDQACLYELVMKAIEALPEKNRIVVTLHYINGWSYEKISDFLAVPKSTISGRMQMAKKQLKETLKNHEITCS